MPKPIVGDRFLVTWAELGKPTVPTDVDIPAFGVVVLDVADVEYAVKNPGHAAFYVRKSRHLGPKHFVVVSRVQAA